MRHFQKHYIFLSVFIDIKENLDFFLARKILKIPPTFFQLTFFFIFTISPRSLLDLQKIQEVNFFN